MFMLPQKMVTISEEMLNCLRDDFLHVLKNCINTSRLAALSSRNVCVKSISPLVARRQWMHARSFLSGA